MYSPGPIATKAAGVETVYVERLRENLEGLSKMKNDALDQEDYQTANGLKDKMMVLQLQLDKLDDQFTSEIIQNSITQWQNEMVRICQDHLAANDKFQNLNSLEQKFHLTFISMLNGIPLSYYDAIVRAMLILFPHELPDAPKSPYGWEFLARKFSQPLKSQESIDFVKATVSLLLMDVVSIAVGRSTSSHFRKETYDLILRHIFHYIHTVSIRKISSDSEGPIFDMVFTRCAVTVSYIAKFSNTKDIFKYVLTYFDSSKKCIPEETALSLSVLRYCFVQAENQSQALEICDYLNELVNCFEKSKKSVVRNAVIQTLERVLQPQGTSSQNIKDTTVIWNEAGQIFKKARKWATSDDLRVSALYLMKVILVNGRIDFFAQNIDTYINTDLCAKAKVRPYAYSCILQLLRGRYYQDTLAHYEESLNGTYVTGRHFSTLTRAPIEQSAGTVTARLNAIADMLFFQRKGPIPEEYRCVSASIVAQIAAHNITQGGRLIGQLLDTSRADSQPDCYYIGLRALRIMLDPESGFQKFAPSRVDPDFEKVMNDFPYGLSESLSSIYATIEGHIGIAILGTSGIVLDISPEIQELDLEQRKIDAETGPASVMVEVLAYGGSSEAVGEEYTTDSNLSSSRTTLMSFRRSGRSEFTTNSMRRSSLLGSMSALNITPSIIEMEQDRIEVDDYIGATINQWFKAVGSRTADLAKFFHSSPLTDKTKSRKKTGEKLKLEQREALKMLQEILLFVQFIPLPEFIGGNYFIGAFLTHPYDLIGVETANALIYIFTTYHDLRLGIINGFLNFLKNTPHRDDISICSNLLVLSRLVKIWSVDIAEGTDFKIEENGFHRVSCKMDAMILLLLSHPNKKIRSICLQTLFDFNTIQEKVERYEAKQNEQSLAAILLSSEKIMVKQAIYAFIQADGYGHLLSSKIASSLTPLSFLEVASSSCTGLFRFYHGELAKRFSLCGRPKATRHLAKYLKILAVPLVEETFPNSSIDFKSLYSSYMNLLMAMAGCPISSEATYENGPRSQKDVKDLLFGCFEFVHYVLTMPKGWESDAILRSFYFLHRDVVQLCASELMQKFLETRQNPDAILKSRFLDNLLSILRHVIQYPHFELLIQDDSKFASNLIQMFSDFLAFTSLVAFTDTSFLVESNTSRIDTAIDFTIIAYKLGTALNSTGRKLLRQARFDGDLEPLHAFERAKWPVDQRRTVISQLKDWYDCIKEHPSLKEGNGLLKSVGLSSSSDDATKLVAMKEKLLLGISLSMVQLMELGDVFVAPPLPAGLLLWLATMESEGFRVFTPEFMYTFEDALGTALASSYSGKGTTSPFVFLQSIFQQILPRLDDGPHMYLFGTSRRMSFAEPFAASIHGLPPKNSTDLDSPTFIYPDISAEDAVKIKQHLGSLLFFGLYNLMSSNCDMRIQSLVFLRELLQMYNPSEETFDAHTHFQHFHGPFYSGASVFIKSKILQLSVTFSELFANDAGSFLWEAVRCARSISTLSRKCLLLNPRKWILELMLPWCQYVNLGAINVDMVNAEFFRFLMDSAFEDPSQNDDIANCWTEVCASSEFGSVNAAVLMDVVIEVSARFDALQNSSLLLASSLSLIQPDLVSTVLAFHLSSAAFPWRHNKVVTQSFQHTSQLAIKDYILSLHSSLNIVPPESENGYTLDYKGSALIVSEIIPQRYKYFSQHLPVIINFILIHLNGSIKKSTASNLLRGCIYGFIANLHDSDSIYAPEKAKVQDMIRKFLGWLEMTDAQVTWDLEIELPTDGFQVTEIPIYQFADILITIFNVDIPTLRDEILEEVVKWAAEGFLGHEETMRSLKICYILLLKKEPTSKCNNFFLPRLLDQVSVLSQLELEAKTLARSGEAKLSGWSQLSKGMLDLMKNCSEVCIIILKIHRLLLKSNSKAKTLETQGTIFWVTFGLLRFSPIDFPLIVMSSIDNLLFMMESIDRSKIHTSFRSPLQSEGKSCDILLTLIPIIFSSDTELQDKGTLALLNFWIILPRNTVDGGVTAPMYTIFYSLTWIFTRLFAKSIDIDKFLVIIKKLEEFLAIYYTVEMEQLQSDLRRIAEVSKNLGTISAEIKTQLFKQCLRTVISYFFNEYGNNIAQYTAQIMCMDGNYRKVGILMAQLLWYCHPAPGQDGHNVNSLRNLLLSFPFIKDPDSLTEELLLDTFSANSIDLIKEMDVASQGRVESMPEFEVASGSIRSVRLWLATTMGILPSNKMYDHQTKMTVKRKTESSIEVTCSAPVNIAVIKYWGKRDSKLILPTNSSLSLTLNQDDLCSTTTIRAVQSLETDKLWINGLMQQSHKRFLQVLQQAREARREMEKKDKSLQQISNWGLVIASENNFPTAAGLASSASGFACMTFCLAELYNLDLKMPEISRIARLGSGSACRSLFGGFVKWDMGVEDDGSDSMAVQVAREDEWPEMEALILVVSDARKDTGSTEGMQETVETSELLKHRIEYVVPRRMKSMEDAIKDRNFDKFAELTMVDSNQFHAVCLDTFPPIFYMNDISRAAIKVINAYNSLYVKKDVNGESIGYRACYTFDAGPNAVIYLPRKYVSEVLALIDHFFPHSAAEKEYYGRAALYRKGAKDHSDLAKQLRLEPCPLNSLKRLISTSIGDGPRLLSTSCDYRSLLHPDKHSPLKSV